MTTGWMFVYTIQPVFKRIVQLVSCKRGIIVQKILQTVLTFHDRRKPGWNSGDGWAGPGPKGLVGDKGYGSAGEGLTPSEN